MRVDASIRKAAIAAGDGRIIGLASPDFVTPEAYYHSQCYRDYNQTDKACKYSDLDETNYCDIESQASDKLYELIRLDLLENPRLVKKVDLREKLMIYMPSMGATEISASTEKHFRRKLAKEFGDLLQFEDPLNNNKLFFLPQNISKFQLAREVVTVSQQLDNRGSSSKVKEIQLIGLLIRYAVRSINTEMSGECNLPPELDAFLCTLLTGNTKIKKGISLSCPATCKLFWAGHHIRGNWSKRESPKINTATLSRKTLANNVELIQMLNRCGHGIAYSQIEKINIAPRLQKMALTPDNKVPLPENIQAYVNTMLAWDDSEKLEETLSGAATWH